MNNKDLLQLKDKVTDAIATENRLNGQLDMLNKRLKDEFNCKTVEIATKKLESITTEIGKLDKQIEDKMEELNELYDFEDE
jgi:Skp family chaperone for outer membrane proteins